MLDALLAYDSAIESLFRELDDEQVGSVDWEGFWIVLQVYPISANFVISSSILYFYVWEASP